MKKKTLTRREFLAVGGGTLAGVSALGLTGCGGGAGPGGGGGTPAVPIDARMAGASPEGYFRILGETINSIVREEYPGSSIAYIPGSPAGSLEQAASGQAELAVAISPVEEQLADAGEPPFEESLEGRYQSIMQIHNEQLQTSVANAQWAQENGIESWEDVAEKQPPMRIAINQQGNVQIVRIAEEIFREYGFDYQDIGDWGGNIEYVGSGEGAALLQDRRVDVFFNAGFMPHSEIEEVAIGVDLSWVSMSEEALQPVAENWGLSVAMAPSGAYDFLEQDEPTIRWPTDLIVNPDVPEDEVYRMTKAIFENAERMRDIHPAMQDFSVESGLESQDRVPLHPGAQRYYEEVEAL